MRTQHTLLIGSVTAFGKTASKYVDIIDVTAETPDIYVGAFALCWRRALKTGFLRDIRFGKRARNLSWKARHTAQVGRLA